jgi:presenilin-like A22 family membrane protease
MDAEKETNKQLILPIAIMGCFFILIHGLALWIIGPFEAAGIQPAFENPSDPMNLVIFFIILLVMTVIILLIAKYWKKRLIQLLIIGSVGFTSLYVFGPVFDLVIPQSLQFVIPLPPDTDLIVSLSVIVSIVAALILVIMLFKFPEWYVIDICGIIVGVGAIAIFGISLTVLLVIILLVALAIYDAISVYKTKHMIDLADTVMDLKLPVLLVVPKIRHYSLIGETKSLKEKLKEGEERDAFFMGLGDVVMPGILVVAVYKSVENALPVALSVIIGTLVGFLILMTFVIKGKPQAGLPCLCGGAIAGYLIGSFIFFGHLVGITGFI